MKEIIEKFLKENSRVTSFKSITESDPQNFLLTYAYDHMYIIAIDPLRDGDVTKSWITDFFNSIGKLEVILFRECHIGPVHGYQFVISIGKQRFHFVLFENKMDLDIAYPNLTYYGISLNKNENANFLN